MFPDLLGGPGCGIHTTLLGQVLLGRPDEVDEAPLGGGDLGLQAGEFGCLVEFEVHRSVLDINLSLLRMLKIDLQTCRVTMLSFEPVNVVFVNQDGPAEPSQHSRGLT